MRELARSIARANMKRAGITKANRCMYRIWRYYVKWYNDPKEYKRVMRRAIQLLGRRKAVKYV
ncbi:MAG: hypothetical protein II008_18290 [Oscillospiraceae bacterium]|nr:hypothetical protein [Oscillospiraceae bacterium]MBQ1805466.1 hypothetical protein [Oscillospiraceae bacterium]